jgi:hypothetical protein
LSQQKLRANIAYYVKRFFYLRAELLQAAPSELLRTVRLIDAVVDEATVLCFKCYVDKRLGELEQVQSQLKLTNQELTRLASR